MGRRGRRLLCQAGDDGPVQDLQHGRLGLSPDQVGGTPGFPAARLAVLETEIEGDGAVDDFNDFADGSLAAAGQNLKAAQLTAARGDEPGAGQALQNLGEKAAWRAGGKGQGGQQGALALRQRGQVNHDAHGVVGSARQLHGCIRFLHLRSKICGG